MLAEELAPGDRLMDPETGKTVYTVLHRVDTNDLQLKGVMVRHELDGGTALRAWPVGTDVPNIVRETPGT